MFKRLFYKVGHWYFTKQTLPYWCILIIDIIIVSGSALLSTYICEGGMPYVYDTWNIVRGLILCVLIFILLFKAFHTYSLLIRYSTFKDLENIFLAIFSGCIVAWVMHVLDERIDIPYFRFPNIKSCCIWFFTATILTTLERIAIRGMFDTFKIEHRSKKIFIYGVKDGGVALANNILNQNPQKYDLAGFVSPDGDLKTKWLMGVQVRRDGPNLIKHMKEADASILMISPRQLNHFREREELINNLIENDIRIMIPMEAEEWDGKSNLTSQLHEVEVEDLLPREKIEVDMAAIGNLLSQKRILITGAAGSIGSEMVRQVAEFAPLEMILIDQAETPMHDVRLMMARKYPDIKAETIVTSITNQKHLEQIFAAHKPDYVFHAAAYKHVPMMEDNPAIAVQNNILGTKVIADLAVKYRTLKFVMISTDKAVNPTNVMGCSKRICEIYCQSLNKAIKEGLIEGVTQFVTTRFGNVLGSNGSVIPLFREQIRNGGPITVTHPEIIRYFMLIPEACKLVLEAGTMGKGGEIFVFDMGKPVKIVDLAKRMINLSGAKGIEIKFTGLRDGEKLYEEVLNDAELTRPTHNPKILIASVREYDYSSVLANEERLLKASLSFNDMEIVKIMKEIVPEYKSQTSKYQILDN